MSEQDWFIQFARELGELNGNIKQVLGRLEKGDAKMAEHESRITLLETGNPHSGRGERTHAIPQWVVWVVISLISLLAGALGVHLPGSAS